MVQVREHTKHTQPHNGLEIYHLHPNLGDNAKFKGGTILYHKAGLIIEFNDRDSHFHIDVAEEFSDLVHAVERGDYDVR